MDSNYIDSNYIWQRRIHHGIRYQKGPVPFPASVEVGLDFNAAFEKKEKLDLSLLTNGVMLELCEFAKTVTKSEMYFLFEMLDFNFDLDVDLDDRRQHYNYAARLHNKVKMLKEQMKPKTHRYHEIFTLPDSLEPTELEQSRRYCPKWSKMDISVLTKDGNSQSSENQRTDSPFIIMKPGGIKLKLTTDAYPNCKNNGVTLVIPPKDTPKQKLDPSLLTVGVVFEVLEFSKVLCGTYNHIIQDLVKQNFGYTLETLFFRLHISKLMERRNSCLTPESKAAFRKETFKIPAKTCQRKYKRRKKHDVDYEEVPITTKRRSTLRQSNCDAQEVWEHSNLSYMCPVDFESELQSGRESGPDKANIEVLSDVEEKLMEVKEEDEEVFVSPVPLSTNAQLFNRRPNIGAFQTITGLFSQDMHVDVNVKTQKQKLWTRRAARSKQILMSSRVNDMYARCRYIGLDFNVGSGRKQNLDLELFTNFTLYEVNKFATAMTKSLGHFFLSLLENNFNLVFQDELHQRNFLFYVITKEKLLQTHTCRDKAEFLSTPVQFPEVYNMVDVTSEFHTGQDDQPEPDPADPDKFQQTDPESHPYCNKIGLNLWATEPRPVSKKLDVTVLTNGAILEIVHFVRQLCGTVREAVNDVLEHNFDLNLQDGSSEEAKAIQRWYLTQKTVMKRTFVSSRVSGWLNTPVIPRSNAQLIPTETDDSLEDLDTGPSKQGRETPVFNGNMQQVPKVECSYDVCQQIGLDLDIRSTPDAKEKLDLQVLTRAAIFEIHRYIDNNCNRYVPALYEILEYNFDLSSQNHRKVEFAWSIASQVIAMVGKNGRKGDYLNRVFELPFEFSEASEITCKEEPDDGHAELDLNNDDVKFVRELKPIDIEVEIE